MPRISAFYGIVVEMYYGDHPPPHFHARYGGETAKIEVGTGRMLAGSLPGRAHRLVRQWAAQHGDELAANWQRVVNSEQPQAIEPLK